MSPEGGTSNGLGIMKFKRGGFEGNLPVVPMITKFERGYFNPDYSCIPFTPLLIMQLCTEWRVLESTFLPTFVPNDYLYETHKDKGGKKWEIFAWAVRDVMAKVGNF